VFDVSFSELMVIAVVALLVIGPEKLPKVARTVGAFTGRMQRYMAQIKEEVNREVRFEELQQLQQEIKQTVETKIVKPLEQEADGLRGSIYAAAGDAKIKPKLKSTANKSTAVAKTQTAKAATAKPKIPTTKLPASKAVKSN
jgi:sec-independent protein translocase protein TatB